MSYTTISGDTFDLIAYKELGDEKLALHIIEANINYAGVIVFGGGINIEIPVIDNTPTSNLPPWKRGGN